MMILIYSVQTLKKHRRDLRFDKEIWCKMHVIYCLTSHGNMQDIDVVTYIVMMHLNN